MKVIVGLLCLLFVANIVVVATFDLPSSVQSTISAVEVPLIDEWKAEPFFHVQPLASASPFGLSPVQIRKAYDLPSSGGVGTIAIIDAYDNPNVQSDFAVFSNQYGLSNNNLEVHKMASSIPVDAGWALEISLDVQWAHAIAPNAHILLVEAMSDSGNDLLSAVSYAAGRSDVVAVSMSWGGAEFSRELNYDSYFTSSYGAAFFASSGDSGAGVMWPSCSPRVVGVGGTTLALNPDGTVASETGWSLSGGGISAFVTEPAYQIDYNVPNASGRRAVPDISYNADPASGMSVYHSLSYGGQSGWFSVGGTSAGAPQWAAIHSLGLTVSNSKLYQDAKSSSSLYFRDIVAGSNGAYYAVPGYDLVTGLGSPITWNFSVGAGIDFSVSPIPSVLSIESGSSGWTNVTVASLNGFTGTVNLSGTAPSGWQMAFTPSPINVPLQGSVASVLSIFPVGGETGAYYVTVTVTSGLITHSSSITVNVNSVPSAPLNLVATAGNSIVSLDWAAPLETGGLVISNYTIYRSTAPGAETKIAAVAGNASNFDDSSVSNGQTYYYQVTAFNTLGESSKSDEVHAIPLGNLSLIISSDRSSYVKWSRVIINVTTVDLFSYLPVQGVSVNASIYDPHGRLIWSGAGVSDVTGKAQLTYLLTFNVQMGNYAIAVDSSSPSYRSATSRITFFALG